MATPIIMPRQGQSVESCILTSWQVKEGDTVTTGQTVATIETDKATFDVESPVDGTVIALFCEEGDDIPVLENIAAVGDAGENISDLRPGSSDAPKEQQSSTSSTTSEQASPDTTPTQRPPAASSSTVPASAGISPRARKTAAKSGVDAGAIQGSGPGGRVIERDVVSAAANGPRLSAAAQSAVAQGAGYAPARGTGLAGRVLASDLMSSPAGKTAEVVRADREIPVKGVRKIVAQRMHQSLSSTAQLTLHSRFDASTLQSFRARTKQHGETFGLPKLTINDLICYATVRTLANHPGMNAHFLGDRIVEYGTINLGVAVDTPRGLMVPVVHGANGLSVGGLSQAIRDRAGNAQQGSIDPDLLTGGTFTITNLGITGVEYFTPVLNAPEVGILGVGGITLQAIRKNGTVEHVDMIGLSLTIDHQAVDGAPAARFLQDLCTSLENIDLLLAG